MNEAPYHFQTKAQDQFLSGDNLIIQAPTGSGKTRAALEPGIRGLHDKSYKYPPRIIYAVPMRVLARNFKGKYLEIANTLKWDYHIRPTIQTGDAPEDALFEGRAIFATVDQVLASYLNIPYGLPYRLANVNSGAFIGSYLIFDEFHLYPRNEMMLTVLAMLKMLNGVSRFTLMSATFSPVFLKEIARLLDAQIIAHDPNADFETGIFHDVPAQERTFYAHDGVLSADRVLELMGGSHSCLCVCNTVDRAQAMYRALRANPKRKVEIKLLHSRFFRADRSAIETKVAEQFKERDPSRRAILVATQVIEVGLDITSDVLISECAPAASLIQRAGRCARRRGEHGQVHIFQPYNQEKEEVSYAPYIEDGQDDICHLTWDALQLAKFNGQVMRFPDEQRLIELAHGKSDAEFVTHLEGMIEQRIGKITECMAQRAPGDLDNLIRKNMDVPLYIHPAPNEDELLTEKPWQREAITFSKNRLARFMDSAMGAEADFVLQGNIKDESVDPDAPAAKSKFKWTALGESKDVYSNWRFVAHPMAVSYDQKVGLELAPGKKEAAESPILKAPAWEPIIYKAERYHEHIAGLWWAYTLPIQDDEHHRLGLREETVYPLQKLCHNMNVDPDLAERLLRLVLALHDVGKLNMTWQQWSRKWHALRIKKGYRVDLPLADPYPLAHTNFDSSSKDERTLQNTVKPPRGKHAVEAASACFDLIYDAAGKNQLLASASLCAIMRHHTPDASQCEGFQIVEGGEKSIITALKICGLGEDSDLTLNRIKSNFTMHDTRLSKAISKTTPTLGKYESTLLYLLFVRILGSAIGSGA